MSGAVTFAFDGLDELKETLLAMEEGAGTAVLILAAGNAAATLTAIMAALAPYRSGALARGINFHFAKSGRGFAKFDIVLRPEVYYGLFQEFGLGDKRAGGVSARTQKRRDSYDATKDLARRGYTSGSAGLTKGQGKRLKALEQGKSLQGQRRPNMKPQPFIRPAIFPNRQRLMDQMLDDIVAGVEAASGVNIGEGS